MTTPTTTATSTSPALPANFSPLSGAEIRERFLAYFEKHGHQRKPSSSLIPDNPTVLLTPAGMLPFVPIFLGIEPPPTPPRATTSQKCARVSGKASDLENVGRTPHHHTFFEMLGNFSFGDYFKQEVIPWAWTFITGPQNQGCLGIPAEHLWVTVLGNDQGPLDTESYEIWLKVLAKDFANPAERILFCGEKDNFWGPPGPTGPCGPCTEIHFDRAPEGPSPKQNIALLDDPIRFTEIWNLVLMELFQDEAGTRTELPRKNVDTGMGLERITMVMAWLAQQAGSDKNTIESSFETDLLKPLVDAANQMARNTSDANVLKGQSSWNPEYSKIVADHFRFVAFAIADGVKPSNEGRGYILRMIIRRMMLFQMLNRGIFVTSSYWEGEDPKDNVDIGFKKEPKSLTDILIQHYGQAYPELIEAKGRIVNTLEIESKAFAKVFFNGMELIGQESEKNSFSGYFSGDFLFKLHDTYGFTLELTKAWVNSRPSLKNSVIDEAGFEAAMAEQKSRSRGARKVTTIIQNTTYAEILEKVGATPFVGYDTLTAEATVLALIVDGQQVQEVSGTNQPFQLVLSQTPFYPESGGQVGDRGTLSREDGHHGLTVVINDTQKVGDLIVHHALFDNGGTVRVGEAVIAQVEPEYRQLAAQHHTATHLLNAALRKVLAAEGGDAITQAGSYVSPEMGRFDFTFPRGLTETEVARVETTINGWIRENVPRNLVLMPIDEAKASGAISMAGETYGDTVRVVAYGQRSKELCGGTHVERLGDIGLVKIISEGSIASGVRRIELVAGDKAYKAFKRFETTVNKLAGALKAPDYELLERVEKLQAQVKSLEKTLHAQKEGQLVLQAKALVEVAQANGGKLVHFVEGLTGDDLKTIATTLADSLESYALVLGSNGEDKAHFVVSLSKDNIGAGLNAGAIVKTLASQCDGGGGGKPNYAQAGGKAGNKAASVLKAFTL